MLLFFLFFLRGRGRIGGKGDGGYSEVRDGKGEGEGGGDNGGLFIYFESYVEMAGNDFLWFFVFSYLFISLVYFFSLFKPLPFSLFYFIFFCVCVTLGLSLCLSISVYRCHFHVIYLSLPI